MLVCMLCCLFFFFKQKTAYDGRISDWSSDVCSSDLAKAVRGVAATGRDASQAHGPDPDPPLWRTAAYPARRRKGTGRTACGPRSGSRGHPVHRHGPGPGHAIHAGGRCDPHPQRCARRVRHLSARRRSIIMKNIRLSGTTKRILIIAAVIVIIGAGWLWMQRGSRDGDALNLYGNVDIREVQLAFRQSGRVAQMLFDEGDHVEPGAHMATFDAQPFEEALAAADAAVAAAQADLDKLRRGLRPQEITQTQEALNQALAVARDAARNFDRQSQLLASGAARQTTVDAARAARGKAVASVHAARGPAERRVGG